MQKQSAPQASPAGLSLSKKPRRVSRPMGAKGTGIIFGGGVYVAENTFRGAQCRIVRLWRTTEARSAAPVPIGRLWTPRSAECTSWERRSSEMTELSASAESEGYAACDDDGGLYCQKRPSRAFFDSLSPAGISCGADSIFRFTRSRQGRPRDSAPLRRRAPGGPSPRPGTARTRRCPSRSSRRPARRYPAA